MSLLTVAPETIRSDSRANLLARHPLTAYFVIAFTGAWLLLAPLVLGQDGVGLLPYHVPFWLYVALFLSATFAGPTLAAFVMTAALDGTLGVRHFVRRFGQWRVGLRWYLLFLVGFPLLYLVPASIYLGLEPWRVLIEQWPTFLTVYLPAVLIFPAIISWGEEIGWRGFAQTRLQVRYGALPASLFIGFLHGIWHLPVFLLVEGPAALGPFNLQAFVTNTLMITVVTLIWTWIFNGAHQSILVASVTHAAFNASQSWVGTLLPHQPEEVAGAVTVALAATALLVIVLSKGQLGYAKAPGRWDEGA